MVFRRKKASLENRHPLFPGLLTLLAIRTLLGLTLAAVLIIGYLDTEIRQHFNGPFQTQPSHLYARPVSLSKGHVYRLSTLIDQLKQRGYRAVAQIAEPGNYAVSGDKVEIYVNDVPPGKQPQMPISIHFNDAVITAITDQRTAEQLETLYLEPLLFGSLQMGAYEDRIALKLHQMPDLLIKAVLAMEDRNFENHIGVDPKGIMRALWANLQSGRPVQGGSTLTQQLVKNLFLSSTRSVSRKVVEAVMAVLMEYRFSKAEILEMYLNEVFLGQSGNRAVHGFALASQYYFGRSIQQLQPHEIALLVSIVPAPSFYNPRRHPERALARRNLVLDTIGRLKLLPDNAIEHFSLQPLEMIDIKADTNNRYPAYVDYLYRQLRQYYSEEVIRTGGIKLYTSMDTEIQDKAQNALSATLSALEKQRGMAPGLLEGAVIVIDKRSGEILALVGGRVSGFSGFNRAIDVERPIGSLIKPAVYLAALDRPKQFSLATLLQDSPLTVKLDTGKSWSPKNYDKQYLGPVPMYVALMKSLNLPTVRLGLSVGIDSVIDIIHRLGITRDISAVPSTLLGSNAHSPLEMAQFYQSLSNGGTLIPLRTIRSIHNQRGEPIAQFPSARERVVDPDSAFLVNYALKQVVSNGTARRVSSHFDSRLGLSGKTGTSDDFRDSWFVGYDNRYLAVVWVGRDDNRSTTLSGASGALSVWIKLMATLDLQPVPKQPDRNIVFIDIDPATGLVANQRCDDRVRLPFIRNFQPVSFAPCTGLAKNFTQWSNK